MKNSRLTSKEYSLVKGALRRIFSRSETRKIVINASVMVGYTDTTRPRVKTWCKCSSCQTPTPKSYMECDHLEPVVPLDKTLDEMTIEELINRIWCDINNLSATCKPCHKLKSKAENKQRRLMRKTKR